MTVAFGTVALTSSEAFGTPAIQASLVNGAVTDQYELAE
jgi:hypothetical protein